MSEEPQDIRGLHALLQRDVLAFENERDPRLLDDIERLFLRFAQMVTLFLVAERDTYYGYFFMSMTFKVAFDNSSIAGIRLDSYPPVFETNPLILMRFSLKEILYIFCHEVDHVLFNHPAEMVRSNPEGDPETARLFNLAADAAVNDQINNEIKRGRKYLKAPVGVITSKVLESKFDLKDVLQGESYLYYFELLKAKACEQKPQEDAGRGQGSGGGSNGSHGIAPIPGVPGGRGSGSAAHSHKGLGRLEADGSENDKAKNAIDATQAAGHIVDHEWTTNNDDVMGDAAETLTEATRELLNEVVEIMGSEARGMMPARFTSQIDRINRPAKLNWKSVLKRYAGTVMAEKQKTRVRLNRRQPNRYDLSGARESKTLKIVVAIDTSASVSDEQVSQIFAEIFAIIMHKKFKLTVIECDFEIQRIYELKSPEDLPDRVCGRGGTSFSPVIRYINQNRRYRDALLIYFTDGMGEQRIPRPLTYRNLWVVFGNPKNLSLKKPYGAVLPLKD